MGRAFTLKGVVYIWLVFLKHTTEAAVPSIIPHVMGAAIGTVLLICKEH